MGGLRNSYNSLRDRHGSSVGSAPIGFVKSGEDEYRSRDGLWTIKHSYKSGYQAHHQWKVIAPDGRPFHRYTIGHDYLTLSDAVQAINEAVALGVIGFLSNFFKLLRDLAEEQAKRDEAAKLRADREAAVYSVLASFNVDNARFIAACTVDRLFGAEVRS
jgi:hypothetical protein